MINSKFPSLPKVPAELPGEVEIIDYLTRLRSRMMDELSIVRKALDRADSNSQTVAEVYQPDEIVQFSLPKQRIASSGYKVTDFAAAAHSHAQDFSRALFVIQNPGVPVDGDECRFVVPYACTLDGVVGKYGTAPSGDLALTLYVNGANKASIHFDSTAAAVGCGFPLTMAAGDDLLAVFDNTAGSADVQFFLLGTWQNEASSVSFAHNTPNTVSDGLVYKALAVSTGLISNGAAECGTAPTGAMTVDVQKNGVSAATATWAPGGTDATVTGLPFPVVEGDVITFTTATSAGSENLFVYFYGRIIPYSLSHTITVDEPGALVDGTISEEVVPCDSLVLEYKASVQTAPSGNLTLLLKVNGGTVLTATIAAAGTEATVTGTYPVLNAGDVVEFVLSGSAGAEDLTACLLVVKKEAA